MQIDILTLFPDMFRGPFDESIVKRAQDKGLVKINLHNLRQWAVDKRGSVDDKPYGGGAGMVIRVDVVAKALEDINIISKKARTILLTPQGKVFTQEKARELSKLDRIILICGHYEGFDERIREYLADEQLSIGDYVLTGGELPAMVVTDTVVRLIPGVLGKDESSLEESFSEIQKDDLGKKLNVKGKKYIEYRQYTRPEEYNGWKVPEILLSGNHKEIEKWREKMAREKSFNRDNI